jgi:hypothetical protein
VNSWGDTCLLEKVILVQQQRPQMNKCLLIVSSEEINRQNFQNIKLFQNVTWLTNSRHSEIPVWTFRTEVYISCSDSINLHNWKYVTLQRITILLHISFEEWDSYMNKCKKEGKKLRTHNLKLSWFKLFLKTQHIKLYTFKPKVWNAKHINTKRKYFVLCMSTAHVSHLK